MSEAASITVRVPLAVRRRPGRKTVVASVQQRSVTAVPTRADPALVKALARAFRWQRLLNEGRYGSISEMAEGEEIERGYLGSLLRLTLLAPDIVEAILDGRQPPELGLPRLMGPFPGEWDRQLAESAQADRHYPAGRRCRRVDHGGPPPPRVQWRRAPRI